MLSHIKTGLDHLDEVSDLLAGKRVGLMTNQTGVNARYQSSIDIINEHFRLTALMACEHGVRGDVQAGEHVSQGVDAATGVPVYSLYGDKKKPDSALLSEFDVFVFDMQDVGARFYTYLYSLSYAMEACAEAGKPMIVLDRPNPIGGLSVQGTMLSKGIHSFVGEYPIPTRYGLTIGEYALFVKDYLRLDVPLTVVRMTGWKRGMYIDETDARWIAPSPNLATQQAAICYPGTCIFEGTNISEGRGTVLPFELIGAPWIDAGRLETRMAAQNLKGVHFRRASFTPTFSKHSGASCHGVQMHVFDRACADVCEAGLVLLDEIRALHGDCFEFLRNEREISHIDLLLGTTAYRKGACDARGLLDAHRPLITEFAAQKRAYELYAE